MKKVLIIILTLVFLSSAAIAKDEKEISVELMPPVVVKTAPIAGDVEVDPEIKEISVTFSKDMLTDRMWSWTQVSLDTFPEISGDVKYMDDKRTCVLPVKLEPGKTYVIWINSGKYNSFRDVSNNSAIPYLLVFQTKQK